MPLVSPNSIALLRWPKAGSTAAESMLRSIPIEWNDEGEHHGFELQEMGPEPLVLTTCRHPVDWYASWLAHVLDSPADWPLLSTWSGGLIEPADVSRVPLIQMIEWTMPLLLSPPPWACQHPASSPIFTPSGIHPDLKAALTEGSLWQACARVYVQHATHVVPQERLVEGLGLLFTNMEIPPRFSRKSKTRPIIREYLSYWGDLIWEADGPMASSLGYTSGSNPIPESALLLDSEIAWPRAAKLTTAAER